MCDVPSSIKTVDGVVHFLTDKLVREWWENQPANAGAAINWDDFTGHGGTEKVLNVHGEHIEGWLKTSPEHRAAILSGECRNIVAAAENDLIGEIARSDNRLDSIDADYRAKRDPIDADFLDKARWILK